MSIRTILLGAAFAFISVPSSARAAEVDVVTIMDNKVFPESITATTSGDLIIGSAGKGAVYRAKAGSDKAETWLDPAVTGMLHVLGVFADNASNTLYVCSIAPPATADTPRQTKYAALRTFDLASGAAKNNYPMIDPDKALCNDIDVAKDGTAYVTDTGGGQVLRLKKGAAQLEVWAKDDRLLGVDGISIGHNVIYVNNVATSRLFAIPISGGGAAGTLLELQASMPLAHPDGMRSLAPNRFLMAENALDVGRITEVTVEGDKAIVKVLKVDPGVTSMIKVGNKVWVDNAKFAYAPNGPLKDKSPEPFVIYAVPYK